MNTELVVRLRFYHSFGSHMHATLDLSEITVFVWESDGKYFY